MKMTETYIPESLLEVWEWKDAVYKDINNLSITEKKAYYQEGLETAAKILNAQLVKNPDGSYVII
jgi:hypothetical protein